MPLNTLNRIKLMQKGLDKNPDESVKELGRRLIIVNKNIKETEILIFFFSIG